MKKEHIEFYRSHDWGTIFHNTLLPVLAKIFVPHMQYDSKCFLEILSLRENIIHVVKHLPFLLGNQKNVCELMWPDENSATDLSPYHYLPVRSSEETFKLSKLFIREIISEKVSNVLSLQELCGLALLNNICGTLKQLTKEVEDHAAPVAQVEILADASHIDDAQ